MSKLALVIVLLLTVGRNNAQNYPAPTSDPLTFFVLIQADDGQPFYIRLDNRLYSSSSAGYLILSRLRDSAYTIAVGFPGQAFPEQRYLLNIHAKDQALYLTREDNRWVLFDSHEEALAAIPDPATAERSPLAGVKKDDAFSQLMSAIVQDTSVMYSTYAAASPDSAPAPSLPIPTPSLPTPTPSLPTPTPSLPTPTPSFPTLSLPALSLPASTLPASSPQTPLSSSPPPTIPPAPDTVISSSSSALSPTTTGTSLSSAPSAPTGVVKLSEHKSTQSLSLVYTDHPADERADTIDVIIPIDTPAATHRRPSPDTTHSAPPTTVTHRRPASPDTIHSTAVTHRRTSSLDTIHSTTSPRHPSPDTPHSTTTIPHPPSPDTTHSAPPIATRNPKPDTPNMEPVNNKPTLPFVNSDCHALATDYDVDKLRLRMLNTAKDDDRIQAAYKIFKTKCFTTRQIRALSEVFTTDAPKFKFLATAYPFVSDDHFPELANLLSDPAFLGKFRTMTDRH